MPSARRRVDRLGGGVGGVHAVEVLEQQLRHLVDGLVRTASLVTRKLPTAAVGTSASWPS